MSDLKSIIDRLKIVSYRLKQYTITTDLKQEVKDIIEGLENLESP